MDDWLSDMTNDVLETLPLPQREVVRLARDERLSEAEIADRLEIPQGIVASRLFRARMALSGKPKAARATVAKKAKAPVALPTLREVEKDIESLRALRAMIDAPAAPSIASLLPEEEIAQFPLFRAAINAKAEESTEDRRLRMARAQLAEV